MSENPLHLLMNPQSIAVVGANNVPTKMGTIQALSILKDGYKGKVFPLHPKEKTVLGCKAYASPEDLPEAPDLAILIVPGKTVIPLIESFGKIGTKRAIIITAGFKETGAAGQKMENELNEVARHYGMRFVGPNCMGIINSQIFLNTTVLPMDKEPGLLGFASQSGTYVTQSLPALRKRGIRFSKAISLGNEANINIVDALEYLGEDEQTKAIILYIEGIRDGKRFLEVARRITPHKPVVAQYVGGSASGARAGLSHTGAMSGPDFLYNGIFKQAGIIRADGVEDLYANGWALATQPPIKGKRVGIMTNSGGPSTTISSVCDSVGLEVPRFSEGLQKEIRKHLQPHASAANPVDLTFDVEVQKLAIKIPEIMMNSGEIDAMVLHGVMMTGYLREIYPHLKEMAGNMSLEEFLKFGGPVLPETFELPRTYNIPFLISSFFDYEDCYTQGYLDNNIPVFPFPEKAALALGCLYHYKQIKERIPRKEEALPEINPLAADIIRQAKQNKQKALDEHAAKQLLACYGVPVTKEELAETAEEALAAAAKIGYPVALKACSWQIMHKSGKGLIALNVEDELQLKKEFQNIQKNAGKKTPVLVQEMLRGNREFLAGITRFAGFGAGVVFGLGGVFTEIYNDTTLRLAPLADVDVQEMFADIRARKLLDDYRGMPKVMTDKLSYIIRTIGNIALLYPEISEIDLNPIMVCEAEPVVADALIVLESKP
ncbi:MAG: CoA-binding protein [Deltaproteobacteria bacterium HGW-Deltaproteobacteria-13]|jgi:acetyltransferase|nr:MAG: CoA-binding protein [Deltaproteobacteria bacterium HGW-Deltaproteobacteria-13]